MVLALMLIVLVGAMAPVTDESIAVAGPWHDEAGVATAGESRELRMPIGEAAPVGERHAAAVAEAPGTGADTSGAMRVPAETPEDRDTVRTRSRSIPARAGRTARHFASDVWLVLSSPARLDRHGAAILGVALATTGAFYLYDEEVLDASIRNRDDPTWHAIQEVGSAVEPIGFMESTIPYYLGAMAAGYALDVRPLREIPAQIIESHLISGLVRNTVKFLVGRRRPDEERGPKSFEIGSGNSFPSGHTSVMFELATIVSHHSDSRPIGVLAYALACTGTLERVHSRSHWPSDLFLSAVSGTMIARTVIRRHERRAGNLETGVFLRDDGTPSLGVRLPLGPAR